MKTHIIAYIFQISYFPIFSTVSVHKNSKKFYHLSLYFYARLDEKFWKVEDLMDLHSGQTPNRKLIDGPNVKKTTALFWFDYKNHPTKVMLK